MCLLFPVTRLNHWPKALAPGGKMLRQGCRLSTTWCVREVYCKALRTCAIPKFAGLCYRFQYLHPNRSCILGYPQQTTAKSMDPRNTLHTRKSLREIEAHYSRGLVSPEEEAESNSRSSMHESAASG